MAQTIRIRRGTKTELIALGALLTGEMGLCTDTKEVYIGDGIANIFVGRVLSGTEAARPNAGVSGRFYYVTSGTNVGNLYLDDGAVWERVNAQKLTDLTGTLDDIADGTTYAKVKKSDLTNGQVNKVSDGTNTKTAVEIKTHIDDSAKHRLINDAGTTITDLWSAQKINNEIELAKHNIEPQASVKDQNLTAPPGSPTTGDRYIIPASATGAWVSQATKIAEWNGASWLFYTPQTGWTCYVDDEQKVYSWNGTAWVRTGGALQTITAGNGLTGGGQADTVSITVGAGNGIAVGTTTVSAKAGKGILVNSTGIEANIDTSSIVYDAGNGNRLMVSVVDGGTF
ncbi:DUF2793 domain-containing protein [Desulfosporosinus meridiei]|uniref:Major tropism determinant N-terminal domain-containing protein n=1 Tax=Desulfosporosinus meridiei (strain ATCC BAA-275 / DSM 13257 / KCTC 12902 / NCIMB 13706 / S10) TaxID=768704 RepID=J7J1E9_DESMD|nr:DUF2793 domain-containing protein [Desulfosporosinus meridiei]AFQ45148.1 Protein of unknown function (DUF2793) [Desulfosporosinus meridiei DSM 13257]